MKKIGFILIMFCIALNGFAQKKVAGFLAENTIQVDGVEYLISDQPAYADYYFIAQKNYFKSMMGKFPAYGIVDGEQKIIIPCKYASLVPDIQRGCIFAMKTNKVMYGGFWGAFDFHGKEVVPCKKALSMDAGDPTKYAAKAFDKLDESVKQACLALYNDIIDGIDTSNKQYYAQNSTPSSPKQTTQTNTSAQQAQQNTSAGGRSYSIEELQALGVIGGGNNNQQPAQQVATTQNTQSQQTAPQRTLSDVDKNIPVTDHRAENTFVLIIANEDYQFVDKVDFAKNDGQTFKEYCVKTLGVPEKQVWLYENASYGVIKSGISKMTKAMNMFDNPNAIIYYCGHGIPDEKTGDAYLIPTDGNGKDMATCYSLNLLYKNFAETKAANVTYFMDACFTGASKEGSMLVAARGVAREPKKETLGGKTVVFSATSSDETAMAFKEKQHGLFTYYLLKKLQETKGDVSYEELSTYIKNNVQKEAFLTNEKPQTPVVATSPAVGSTWKTMKLK